VEHGVTEGPVRLRRDLLLGVSGGHFELQQRVKVIWMLQNRFQSPHSQSFCVRIWITTIETFFGAICNSPMDLRSDGDYDYFAFWVWQIWKIGIYNYLFIYYLLLFLFVCLRIYLLLKIRR